MRNFDEPKNILIIRTDRIGDVVLTTPAIHALRRRFPKARISILIAPPTLDLLKGNPDIDAIFFDDRGKEHAGWRGFWKLVRQVKQENFDCVINYHTKRRTNLLCFLARIPRRIGYLNNKFGFLLTDKIMDDRPSGQKHEAQYCLDVLNVLGVENRDLMMHIPVQEEDEKWAERFFHKFLSDTHAHKYVAIHLESSCPTKRWPVQYFADVVCEITAHRKVFFLVIGTDKTPDLVMDLWKLSGQKHFIYNLVGQTSLARTVSLLKRCDLLISNDSGPVHIAAALEIPVISIFTRNQPGINPKRWRPLGEKSYYVAPDVDMGPSFKKGKLQNTKFLYHVSPQQVLDVVDAVFKL